MRTRILGGVCLGVVVAAGLTTGAQVASAQGICGQLWQERNAIYAQFGHCFKTQRAINVFGRGCFPPFGKLPPGEQARVNSIIIQERRNGCTG